MAGIISKGTRQYVCLVPVVVRGPEGGEVYETFTMMPVTRRIERDWQDGRIDGPNGMLEALIERLVVEPYYAIDAMQHPDVELFNLDFLTHLPRSMRDALARGEYPMPPAGSTRPPPPPPEFDPGPDDPPDLPDWPAELDEPAYVGPESPEELSAALGRPYPPQAAPAAPQPARAASQAQGQYREAEIAPEQTRSPMRERAADAARGALSEDGRELARALMADDGTRPDNPALAAAVARSSAPSTGFVATPRNPFDPSRPPPTPSTNQPPTQVSAENRVPTGTPMPQRHDPVAGVDREVVYEPPPGYVPDMAGIGQTEPQKGAQAAYGIGDLEQ